MEVHRLHRTDLEAHNEFASARPQTEEIRQSANGLGGTSLDLNKFGGSRMASEEDEVYD
jgi:hypothetical protein